MLGVIRPIEPSGYEITQAPQPLRRASARLRDGTIVYPLLVSSGQVRLTLSGILLAGESVTDRYVVYRHLVDLGLAGPTAPELQWSAHIRPSITDRGILPFHALTALPAELLAIPCPHISWAFDNAPIMTLPQWETYRQRRTSRVVMSSWPNDEAQLSWPGSLAPSAQRCISLTMGWLVEVATDFARTTRCFGQVLVGILMWYFGNRPKESRWRWSAGAQDPILQIEAVAGSHNSDSTELRMPPNWQRAVLDHARRTRLPDDMTKESSSLIPAESHTHNKSSKRELWRPSIAMKGCLPKGGYLSGAFFSRV